MYLEEVDPGKLRLKPDCVVFDLSFGKADYGANIVKALNISGCESILVGDEIDGQIVKDFYMKNLEEVYVLTECPA